MTTVGFKNFFDKPKPKPAPKPNRSPKPNRYKLNLKLGERCSNSSECNSKFCSFMNLTGECGLSGKTFGQCFCLPRYGNKVPAKSPTDH